MSTTARPRRIVCGVDPVSERAAPLEWAADEARRRRLELLLVVAVPARHDTQHVDDAPRQQARVRAAHRALRAATDLIRRRHTDIDVRADVREGFPAPVLAELSREAELLVLGSRHLGRIAEFLSAGSVVVPLTARALCPVVVVGDPPPASQHPPHLVVGVDGSRSCAAAVALAFEEADLQSCALRAVAVRQPPLFSPHLDDADLERERLLLAQATAGWAEKFPDVEVGHEVRVGSPVECLAGAAEHAQALVVARRGHGSHVSVRLGSVAHGLLHRSCCPVVVVPPG